MYKIFFISFFLIITELSAQIKLSVQILGDNRNVLHLQFTISNETSSNIVLPIDTIGFKTYMSEDNCTDFNMIRNYPDLGIIPMVENNNSLIESMYTNKGHITSISANKFYLKNEKEYNKQQKIILEKWKKKLGLHKKTESWIKINHYLFNHLLFLKSHQKVSFSKELDLSKINDSPNVYGYNYYPLQENSNYEIFFKICIDEYIYQYLTKEQKDQCKNDIFFKGKIESNKIEFKTSN